MGVCVYVCVCMSGEIIAEDVEDFEYTPKPEFDGPFEVGIIGHQHHAKHRERVFQCQWLRNVVFLVPCMYITGGRAMSFAFELRSIVSTATKYPLRL